MGNTHVWVAMAMVAAFGAAASARAQDGSSTTHVAAELDLATFAPVGDQRAGLWLTDYRPGRAPFIDIDSVAFKPWARGLFDSRQQHDLEPHARCKPSGAIRQFLTPYGVEIVEFKESKRLYIFDIGGPHSYREVYLDGRSHPADVLPSAYGHNIGWWDGDTFVIDSTGYSEGFWFERMGLPHTEAVQITEYFKRTDPNTILYTFVMNDPLTYDSPVEGRLTLRWQEGDELFEYVCQQQNYAHDLMVNPETLNAIGETSRVVP